MASLPPHPCRLSSCWLPHPIHSHAHLHHFSSFPTSLFTFCKTCMCSCPPSYPYIHPSAHVYIFIATFNTAYLAQLSVYILKNLHVQLQSTPPHPTHLSIHPSIYQSINLAMFNTSYLAVLHREELMKLTSGNTI